MNKCIECVKKYSDKWGVPLLSGTKRSRDEECSKICELDGTTPEQGEAESRSWPIFLFFILVILAVIGAVIYFTGIEHEQEQLKVLRYSSGYPVSRESD